jgi:hypothetical protein
MSRALVYDLAIPPQAELRERLQDLVGGAVHDARRVEVLDAHEPSATGGARIEPARRRGNERAHVQWTGGRGREPADIHMV